MQFKLLNKNFLHFIQGFTAILHNEVFSNEGSFIWFKVSLQYYIMKSFQINNSIKIQSIQHIKPFVQTNFWFISNEPSNKSIN